MGKTSDRKEEARLEACALLEAWGIDPNNVSRRDVTEWGYCEFVRDDDGHKIYLTDGAKVIARDWPKDFPVDILFRLVHQMNGAVL